jgi:cell filamentation protein
VYPWAGRDRSVNLGKGDFHFAVAAQIPRLMDLFSKDILSIYTPCNGMSDNRLVEAIAISHVELILIHPFREGNGRLSRILANVMAMQAGNPELDFTSWDCNKDAYFAAVQEGLVNYEPMKELVRQVLR